MRTRITSYLLSIWLGVALVALLPALGGCVQEKADNSDAAANGIVGAEHVTRMLLQQGGDAAGSTSSGMRGGAESGNSANRPLDSPPSLSPVAVFVRVAISPDLAAKAESADTVFVFARAAQGPRMPLAIVRGQVKDLPATVRLDDSLAMTPNLKLSDVRQVIVGARVSKSGDATPHPGDLEGFSPPVETGTATPIVVTINQVVAGKPAPVLSPPSIPVRSADHAVVGAHATLEIPPEVAAKWKSVELAIVGAGGTNKTARLELGGAISVPGTDLVLYAAAFVPSFEANSGRVTSRSNELDNPAVLVKLTQRDRVVAEGWVFQKFPQFNTFLTENIQVSLTGAYTSGAK